MDSDSVSLINKDKGKSSAGQWLLFAVLTPLVIQVLESVGVFSITTALAHLVGSYNGVEAFLSFKFIGFFFLFLAVILFLYPLCLSKCIEIAPNIKKGIIVFSVIYLITSATQIFLAFQGDIIADLFYKMGHIMFWSDFYTKVMLTTRIVFGILTIKVLLNYYSPSHFE